MFLMHHVQHLLQGVAEMRVHHCIHRHCGVTTRKPLHSYANLVSRLACPKHSSKDRNGLRSKKQRQNNVQAEVQNRHLHFTLYMWLQLKQAGRTRHFCTFSALHRLSIHLKALSEDFWLSSPMAQCTTQCRSRYDSGHPQKQEIS